MSNAYKKLKSKQYKLRADRVEINKIVERLTKQVNKNSQIFDDCSQIKIEEPLDSKVFDRLMILHLERLEDDKIQLQKSLDKQKVLINTPDYCEI